MSPWFSRGWTALELAKSPKVKVISKGPYGPLKKDLDEQILEKMEEPDGPRQKASQIIKHLRQGIALTLKSILEVLGPRHTSWPKDRAIISGLLVDVELSNDSKKDVWQQDIYKDILRKMGKVSPGHLFHNSATMSKVSWCPITLFDMPTTNSEVSLDVTEDFDLIGQWKVIPVNNTLREKCVWNSTHLLIERKVQDELTYPDKCVLLAESNAVSVNRALLVKAVEKRGISRTLCCQYIGALYFHPAMLMEYTNMVEEPIGLKVRVLGDTNDETVRPVGNAWELVKKLAGAKAEEQVHLSEDLSEAVRDTLQTADLNITELASQRLALHCAVWRGHRPIFKKLVGRVDPNQSERLGQQPLHLAAERGDEEMVRDLLDAQARWDAQCNYGQTALHRAAWGGSTTVVGLLANAAGVKDKGGNLAFHIAAEKRVEPVAEFVN